MSKIAITVDTETTDIAVSIDGEKFDDVSSVSIYKYMDYMEADEQELCITINSSVKMEGGMRKSTTVYASENGARIAIAKAFKNKLS